MNLDNLKVDKSKEVNIYHKKTRGSNTSNNTKKNNKNTGIKKPSKFSRKQRRRINSGDKRILKDLKAQFPERFKCSSCKFSDNSKSPTWCFLHKNVIMGDNMTALLCNNIEV